MESLPKKSMSAEELKSAALMSFKIIDSEFIDDTIATEKIYLGCADRYAYLGSCGNKGQGDKNEGIFARVPKNDVKFISDKEKLYKGDLIKCKNGEFIDLKLKSVINMPIYCFYTINALSPGISYQDLEWDGNDSDGFDRIYNIPISEKVLGDFSNSGSFALINFLNHAEISNLIESAIRKDGIGKTLQNKIHYVNRQNVRWECLDPHPQELFYKDEEFSYQSERRIIVLDDKMNFMNQKNKIRSKKSCCLKLEGLAGKIQKKPITLGNLYFEILVRILKTSS